MEKNTFAYINVTHIKDINYSISLYNSFKKFYKGKSPYFITCPEADFSEFAKHFPLAILIKEEDVIIKAELPLLEYNKLAGYHKQQILKLTISDILKDLKNYFTIDSDVIFVRDFNDEDFFENGMIKTICYKWKQTEHGNKISDVYAKYGKVEIPPLSKKMYFIDEMAPWNVEVVKDLKQFISKTPITNFNKMIEFASVELEWYGKFMYIFHKEKLIPINKKLGRLSGIISNKLYKQYKSKELIYAQYLDMLKNNEFIAISLQYNTKNRAKETLQDIILQFEGKQINKPVYTLIKFIAFFGIPKVNNTKIKSKLAFIFRKYLFKY
jgi:hypothetical protein